MRTILIALIAASASVAVAAPDTKPSDDSDMSFTWSTGRGRLGFATIQISPELRLHLGAPSDRGAFDRAVSGLKFARHHRAGKPPAQRSQDFVKADPVGVGSLAARGLIAIEQHLPGPEAADRKIDGAEAPGGDA